MARAGKTAPLPFGSFFFWTGAGERVDVLLRGGRPPLDAQHAVLRADRAWWNGFSLHAILLTRFPFGF